MSLSRRLNELGFTSHVQSFISRPVIHVKPKNSAVSKVYTFVDCVTQFEAYFDTVNLTSAYRKAGSFFSGTLARYFVVLKNENSTSAQPVRSKRPRDSGNTSGSKKSR